MTQERTELPFVCMYTDYLDRLAPFTAEERGSLLTAMLTYARTGEVPEFTGNERFIWPTLQAQLDRDIQAYWDRYERNRRNGSKGGRKKKNPEVSEKTGGFSEEPTLSNKNKNENENKNQNKSKSENENKIENQKESESQNNKPAAAIAAGFGPLFLPPTVDEVRSFCKQQGYGLDPGRFVDYYTANGWQMGSAPMKDWKAALKCWNGKERPNGKTSHEPTWHVGTEL